MICSKRKYAKNIKSNTFKNDFKCVSRRCGSYKMYFEGDSFHQVVMIMCECIWFSLISSEHFFFAAYIGSILRWWQGLKLNFVEKLKDQNKTFKNTRTKTKIPQIIWIKKAFLAHIYIWVPNYSLIFFFNLMNADGNWFFWRKYFKRMMLDYYLRHSDRKSVV